MKFRHWIAVLALCADLAAAQVPEDPKHPNVAVLPLSSQGVDSVSALVVTDALSDELLHTGKVQVMERSQIRAILDEQGLQKSGACDGSECAVQTGRLLAVQEVVVGTIGRLGDSYSLSVRLVDMTTGQVSRSSHRMQQGAIDAVVAQALPEIAAELMGTEPPSSPRKGNPALLSREPSRDTLWSRRHDGFHFRSTMVVGISSSTEAPFSMRLGAEYDGFGVLVGAGPLFPILSTANQMGDYRLSRFIPDLSLFYGWDRFQVHAGFSQLGLRESGSNAEKTFQDYSVDLLIHLGLPGKPRTPGGFGILFGLGIMQYEDSWTEYTRTDSYINYTWVSQTHAQKKSSTNFFPVPHFAIVLSNW